MRLLLTTLAVMAVATPAFAVENSRDPEGSIQQSDAVSHQADGTSTQMNAEGASRYEPAAGQETTASGRVVAHNEPVTKGDRAAATKMKTTKSTHMSHHTSHKKQTEKLNDAEGTVAPSRTVQ